MAEATGQSASDRQGPGNPAVRKGSAVGARLRFRDVTVDDAEFILGLRTDEVKGRHLSPTSPDIDAQRRYLESYGASTNQAFFIIETLSGAPVGTIRIYDPQGTSFCWGSWILADDAPKSSAVESTLMIYRYGLELGFDSAHFDVRKANEKVWQYHERCGAKRVRETDIDYFYTIDREAIEQLLRRYESRVPNGISVDLR
ncbi:MAG TPA: GNAT family N-acetyltransferase [Allosphingosinicella sp.]|jgi:RimJ/RimL family protein N-acetyltransferase